MSVTISNCDGCNQPRGQYRTVLVYGCEGDFCHLCRHGADCDCEEGDDLLCSACGFSEPLTEQVTREIAEQDGWLLEPVVYCPKHGPDDERERS